MAEMMAINPSAISPPRTLQTLPLEIRLMIFGHLLVTKSHLQIAMQRTRAPAYCKGELFATKGLDRGLDTELEDYEEAFDEGNYKHPSAQILRTCRHFYQEGVDMLYSKNTFALYGPWVEVSFHLWNASVESTQPLLRYEQSHWIKSLSVQLIPFFEFWPTIEKWFANVTSIRYEARSFKRFEIRVADRERSLDFDPDSFYSKDRSGQSPSLHSIPVIEDPENPGHFVPDNFTRHREEAKVLWDLQEPQRFSRRRQLLGMAVSDPHILRARSGDGRSSGVQGKGYDADFVRSCWRLWKVIKI
ncbi:hypothetical protein BT63DRAFT_417918 [Microthyrium microscopicum]|uniref:DUF7730 domain-containing protein n=1 Tax=Microthyrium microscopicum TaxID=703497 RepID=A0A6A6TWX0_9PEZI|nr:hypothetical protein BT63DRAFT_417918 [Microthyrium microscopicum]